MGARQSPQKEAFRFPVLLTTIFPVLLSTRHLSNFLWNEGAIFDKIFR
jgi:hypothetical protein